MMKLLAHLCWLLCLWSAPLWAWTDWFRNSDQQAQHAYTQEQYQQAATLFADPYQRGVALYRAGDYAAAAEAFAQVDMPEQKINALYNQGNSYFQQEDYAQAISQYENVLKKFPNHADAQHNLELARQKLAEQQQSKPQNSQNQNNESGSEQSQDQQQAGESQQNNAQSNDSQHAQNQQGEEDAAASNSQSQNPESASPQENSAEENAPTQAGDKADEVESSQETADAESMQQQAENAQATEAQQAADASAGATTTQLPSEIDMRADALLNRLQSNQQDILRSQFYIDARRSDAVKPEQTW